MHCDLTLCCSEAPGRDCDDETFVEWIPGLGSPPPAASPQEPTPCATPRQAEPSPQTVSVSFVWQRQSIAVCLFGVPGWGMHSQKSHEIGSARLLKFIDVSEMLQLCEDSQSVMRDDEKTEAAAETPLRAHREIPKEVQVFTSEIVRKMDSEYDEDEDNAAIAQVTVTTTQVEVEKGTEVEKGEEVPVREESVVLPPEYLAEMEDLYKKKDELCEKILLCQLDASQTSNNDTVESAAVTASPSAKSLAEVSGRESEVEQQTLEDLDPEPHIVHDDCPASPTPDKPLSPEPQRQPARSTTSPDDGSRKSSHVTSDSGSPVNFPSSPDPKSACEGEDTHDWGIEQLDEAYDKSEEQSSQSHENDSDSVQMDVRGGRQYRMRSHPEVLGPSGEELEDGEIASDSDSTSQAAEKSLDEQISDALSYMAQCSLPTKRGDNRDRSKRHKKHHHKEKKRRKRRSSSASEDEERIKKKRADPGPKIPDTVVNEAPWFREDAATSSSASQTNRSHPNLTIDPKLTTVSLPERATSAATPPPGGSTESPGRDATSPDRSRSPDIHKGPVTPPWVRKRNLEKQATTASSEEKQKTPPWQKKRKLAPLPAVPAPPPAPWKKKNAQERKAEVVKKAAARKQKDESSVQQPPAKQAAESDKPSPPERTKESPEHEVGQPENEKKIFQQPHMNVDPEIVTKEPAKSTSPAPGSVQQPGDVRRAPKRTSPVLLFCSKSHKKSKKESSDKSGQVAPWLQDTAGQQDQPRTVQHVSAPGPQQDRDGSTNSGDGSRERAPENSGARFLQIFANKMPMLS